MNTKFIALEASAGSGKTHNLTKRYISLLLNFDADKHNPVPLQNILALTFTNKATCQMKERIIDSLKKIALGCDTQNLTEDINLPKNKILQNALTAINNLIQNYDKFNVRTIDSFINLIIKACSLKLDISPNYKILNSYNEYINYATDSFLNEISVNKDVENILNYFFDQFVLDSTSSWDIKGFILNKFKEFYGKEMLVQKIHFDDRGQYLKVLNILSAKFNSLCMQMTKIKEFEGLNEHFKTFIEDKIKTNPNYLFQYPRKISTYFQKEEPPYNKNSSKSSELDELFENAKKIVKEIFEYRAFHYYDTYLRVFDCIVDEFDKRSQKDSVLFLQDINRKILKIFQSSLLPEIYYRLSNTFKDFLVDEFQDTNMAQWETLNLIVEENLSQNGSFFYVGDKKQAIYGFRGSDFRIFDKPLIDFSNYHPERKTLTTNYRSYQEIVDFNNAIFSPENIENLINYIIESKHIKNVDKYGRELMDVFATAKQYVSESKKNKGYVEISCYKYSKQKNDFVEDKIKEYLYKKIEEITKRFSYKDITILCRENKEVEKIGKWLLEKNINIESFKTMNIVNSNIIKDLFSILQFLNSPMDNISFSTFISSDIFLKETNFNKTEILNFLQESSFESRGKNILYVKFRKKYSQVWKDYIEEFFKSAGFVAVYELTIAIIAKFNILKRFPEKGNVLLRFLELISKFETKQQGLQNFIDYFNDDEKNKENEEFFIKVPAENAIKIMSIHKAKGLQFNVVIMPYFSFGDVKAENPFQIPNGNEFSFAKIEQELTKYSNVLNDIYYKKYFKSLSDELNILYVATTRAVYEFYGLIVSQKEVEEDKQSLIDIFVPEQYRILGRKQIYDDKKNDMISVSSNMEITASQFDDITELICDSAVAIYGAKNKDILLKGLVIHYALSLIKTFNKDSFNDVINNAVKGTKFVYPEQDIKNLDNILDKLLSQENIAQFFEDKNQIFNEKEFVDRYGNTVRIDKLVIKDDEIDIVDYKTSIYDKEYIQKQLNNYRSIVEEIYPGKKIKCFVVEFGKNLLHSI